MQITNLLPPQKEIIKKAVQEFYHEYCEKGRSGKAYSTIKKQDSLWNNHIKNRFGKRYIDEISKQLDKASAFKNQKRKKKNLYV